MFDQTTRDQSPDLPQPSSPTTSSPVSLLEAPANPYLSGALRPVRRELDISPLQVEGRLPNALNGAYLRNGPNPAVTPSAHYHMLDGDGMVHGVWLTDGRAARYKNRWVRTEGFQREQQAGRWLYSGLGDPNLPSRMVNTLARQPWKMLGLGAGLVQPHRLMDHIFNLVPIKNAANTSVIRHGGRILALWECGPPHELDADLETLGRADFPGGQPASFFTAHPKVDPVSGELHTFGLQYFPSPCFHYYAYDVRGQLTQNCRIPLGYRSMMHDFAVTPDYLVLLNSPLLITMDAPWSGTKEGFAWRPDLGCEVIIVDRAALAAVRPGGDASRAIVQRLTTDAAFILHLGNAHARQGVLHLDACAYDCPPMRLGQMSNPLVAPFQPARPVRFAVDLTAGSVRRDVLSDDCVEFPLFNDHHRGFATRYAYYSAASAIEADGSYVYDSLVCFDHERGARDSHVFQGEQLFEAVFAIDPTRAPQEDAGWLLCTSWQRSTDRSWLNVLDAGHLADGPIARVELPQRVAQGIHGTWAPTHNCRPGCAICGA